MDTIREHARDFIAKREAHAVVGAYASGTRFSLEGN
jgi:hypothetical protein